MRRKNSNQRILSFSLIISLLVSSLIVNAQTKDLLSPESYFGFKMGADRKLARWIL